MIGNCIKPFHGRDLHADGKKSGENTFGARTKVIDSLKLFRTVVYGFSYIFINSKVSSAAIAIEEAWMHPWADKLLANTV